MGPEVPGSKHDSTEDPPCMGPTPNHTQWPNALPLVWPWKPREGLPAEASYSSSQHVSKSRGPSQNSPRVAANRDTNITKLQAVLSEVYIYTSKLNKFLSFLRKILSLKQYRDETNATIDTNYFSMALKNMRDGFAEIFEQFKTNKSTFALIVIPLNTNTNEINIEPFGIDAGSLQMQLMDLKTKDLWSGKFTELKSKLEVQKCMHIAQHK
ncbi:hypothetical protein AVEN_46946-1 [Araneus ventricosus]|uniref:Uncharacterized protein n=1 Tax=Araneus ventricosus TaxID=182803 RepID=A0A4Y2FMH1_ARAVE|nr:hypothetical protein AVEN_46946-1 [Araneus ventricosus]